MFRYRLLSFPHLIVLAISLLSGFATPDNVFERYIMYEKSLHKILFIFFFFLFAAFLSF